MPISPSEAETRARLIDGALEKAGWNLNNPQEVGQEIPVDGFDAAEWQKLQKQIRRMSDEQGIYVALPIGISDYVLYRENGEALAVVEAKRTTVDVRLAEAQVAFYVKEFEKRQSFRPFAFLANGKETYFWDVGNSERRQVQGFFTRTDLERLLFIQQHKTPLAATPISIEITNRSYQIEAVRRISEGFEQGRRKALIVMATGTGKTRVAMSIVDVFLNSQQAQNILFVADRDALVTQAQIEGFKTYIPNEPITRIYTTKIDKSSRLYVSTLQTLSNCFEQFSPAFFDLIIFDEVHRSIFNKWNEVLQYFDGQIIGLTATPASYIDRNSFLEFGCTEEIPTSLYERKQAVDDKYLVDFELYRAQTHFQRAGIRGATLTEEDQNTLAERGIDPDEIDYSGTDIERTVSNTDTLRKQWLEFWEVARKDPSGLPGKTIVFAMTQDHAIRLKDAFYEVFPQYPDLVKVITYKSDFHGTLIEQFKKESLPRIAISVDMLETGVNIPEAMNLVFMRPVQSPIKMEQMIGRGTRTQEACMHPEWLPEGGKVDFLIIDFWENEFNREPVANVTQSLPVSVTIFNTRIKLLKLLLEEDPQSESEDSQGVIRDLRAQVAEIPRDSISVQRELNRNLEIEVAWEDDFWQYLTERKLDFLSLSVAPLLRFAPGGDIAANTLISKVERLKLQLKSGNQRAAAGTAESIAEDLSLIKDSVLDAEQRAVAHDLGRNPRRLLQATMAELTGLIERLAEQMKNRQKLDTFQVLDLKDVIESRAYILLTGSGEEVYVEEYRRRVDDRVLSIVAADPTIAALERGETVSDEQLLDLERTLRERLGHSDLELNEDNIRKAYAYRVDSLLAFLRNLLGLEALPDYADILNRQFAVYMARGGFSADQIRFLRAVQNTLAQRKHIDKPDLYEDPFTSFGRDAVERLFTSEQIDDMMTFVDRLET
jgi:type I restriction enzyme, R subunit